MHDEKLIATIRKLTALAENNPNQHEASAAAAKVQRLLADHNIEMSQSDLLGSAREQRKKTDHDRAAMYNYQRDLMSSIAKNNFCMHFVESRVAPSNGKVRKVFRHVLLGRAVNITACILMYDYLVDTFDRLLPYQGVEKRGAAALSWLQGCTQVVTDRLADKRREMVRQAKEAAAPKERGGNQLTILDAISSEDDLNEDALGGLEPGTTAARRAQSQARYEAACASEREKMVRAAELKEKREAATRDTMDRFGCDREWAEEILVGIREPVGPTAEEKEHRAKIEARKLEVLQRQQARREKEINDRAKRQEQRDRAREDAWYARNCPRDLAAFKQGAAAGATVGLDDQVSHEKKGVIA